MQEKERYIHSLIVPFKALSDILYPAPIECIDEDLQKFQTERLKMRSERFREIMNTPTNNVEKSLGYFDSMRYRFANRLDALLLQNGIDLMKLQRDCGVFLKSRRCITDVDEYIGSAELAKKYISELPNDKDDNTGNTTNPPQQYQLTFTKELEQKFLAVYSFWHELDSKTHINIFKNTTQQEFTNMVCHAVFSGMTTTNILQRVQMTVYILSKLIDDEWGKRAAQSLNTDIATCQKRCSGDEGQAMKSKFLQ
jgi:hypothetical protein